MWLILSEMDLIDLCSIDDLSEDEGFPVEREGRSLAVWHVGDDIYVTDDVCTHGNGSLSREGALDGIEIVCGLHMGGFDVRTGEPLSPPCHIPLVTYTPVIIDGRVLIRRP
jgi:nitrite reductase/ring-hydroxylating ferredoxin subunit